MGPSAGSHPFLLSLQNHEVSSVGVAAGHIEGLSLEPMRALMHLLGDPQRAYPVIHVTGTNGKGTVAHEITALLVACGLRVGTYTSPHQARVEERVCRNGEPVDPAELIEALDAVANVAPLVGAPLTWFEAVTAAGFEWFADVGVDAVVLEVGLLGRYDATNVADGRVAVITNIGPDHTDGSPGWEVRVMSEKAGIIKPGATAVIGVRDPELVALAEAEGPERCWRLDHEVACTRSQLALGGRLVDLRTPMGEHREVFVPLHGEHQGDNAALALGAVCALFDRDVAPELVASGFASVRVPGRLEVVGRRPLVILDGAHNPPALAALARAVNDEFEVPGARFVVFGMLAGRDPEAALAQLVDLRPDLVVCVPVPSPEPSPGSRAGDPAALARIGDELGLPTRAVADLDAATRLLRRTVTADDVVVVAGSFRLLEPARATLVPALAALTV